MSSHILIEEAFFVSTLNSAESRLSGMTLSKYLGCEISFLIKVINANDYMSIQVHPNEHRANELENSIGKTDYWLIIDCKPYNYLSFN